MKNNSVIFNKEQKTFTILDGTKGTYPYTDILKCSVLNEDAKFRGKTAPFMHCVLSGVTMAALYCEPTFYVGLRVFMKGGKSIAIYVSKKPTTMNTDVFFEDNKEAQEIKKRIDRIIAKYHTED